MDALFFLARREDALNVASSDDLPSEPVADALRIEGPAPLVGLGEILEVERRARPLRDATCRSFPVWDVGSGITQHIAGLDDDGVDDAAERWWKRHAKSLDADLFQIACCLSDLRDAIREGDPGETLFVLLEERAW
ncbi:MAG: hypothetical protein VX466_12070 [Myxococcota bacterium]|nr:hypothetical protein [Myxococcota bacterium]